MRERQDFVWVRRAPVLALIGLLAVAGSGQAVELSFTPRFGYYFDNTGQRQSAVDYNDLQDPEETAATQELVDAIGGQFANGDFESARNYAQLAFPQYGGTVTFAFDSRPDTQFAFTALYGETSGKGLEIIQRIQSFAAVGLLLRDTQVTNIRTTADYSRLDLEGTVQHRLNETFSLIGGVRAERFNIEGTDAYATVQSFHFYNAINDELGLGFPPRYQIAEPRNIETHRSSSWTYSARAGAAAYAPVGDKHLFYVNGLLHVSYYNPGDRRFTNSQGQGTGAAQSAVYEPETTVGPDISVGYLYRFSDRFAIDVRYRATVYFTVSGPSEFKDSRVNHGVGVGFTTWLGR